MLSDAEKVIDSVNDNVWVYVFEGVRIVLVTLSCCVNDDVMDILLRVSENVCESTSVADSEDVNDNCIVSVSLSDGVGGGVSVSDNDIDDDFVIDLCEENVSEVELVCACVWESVDDMACVEL